MKKLIKLLLPSNLVEVFEDAFAFVTNPEARKVSEFYYSNGNPKSIRVARKEGLIK